ncbi:hypothetical protein BHE74_00059526 [Ensete ventricosum]|nr:hypothetical protein BHE74_00059526 [Ensete ventricosum]
MAPPQSIGGSTGDSRPWDPPFDPTQPSIPISYPITTLEALASGSYYNSFHYPFNRSSVPLPPSAVALPPRRRILVCHDMKGGYTDDALVQGGDNSDAYAIWHWYLMDVFVYFSHYLVTLPPPCWTNAAHTHGEPGVEDSAGVAGERRFDVYMGIDVFGRGTFGGGQWNVRLDENSVFGVILELVSETNAKAYILIEDDSQPPFAAASFEFDKIIKPQQISKKGDSTWTPFCGTFNMTGGYTLTDIYIVGASKDAAVEMEQSPLDPKGGSPSSYRASLGQIRIFNTPTSYPPADAWGIDLSYTSWTATHPDGSRILSLKISWKLEEGDMTSFTRYNVYVEKSMSRGGNGEARPIYLGFATAEHFYVSHLVIPNGVGVVRFIVQVCGVDGSCQELDKSPTLELQPPHSRG